MPYRKRYILLVLALLTIGVSCGSSWQVLLSRPAGGPLTVDATVLQGLARFFEEVDGRPVVPLERVLAYAGHEVVDTVTVIEADGTRHQLNWAAVAAQSWWLPDGQLRIVSETLPVAQLEVTAPALLDQATVRITDVAPTIAAALGLPAPAQAAGHVLERPPAGRVLLVILDGFGYLRYVEARQEGLIPNLAALGEPRMGLTGYPPITVVATAALLTGAPPATNGVEQRGTRKTEVETLLDVVAARSRRVAAVEGESLAFNLRGADTRLSGDRDGDGHTDDNVLSNTLAVLQEGMPDLLFVHFHGIDDTGHTYGPGVPEEEARISAVDRAVGQILAALPSDVLVVILSDHGMHPVQEEGRLGDHGHLIAADMLIPVWIVSR